jgi:hypothetical protein
VPALLQKLPHLTRLNLYGCKRLSCAGMKELINLPLKALALGHTRIRCEGLKHISSLTQLTELHLVKEEVKLEGLLHLHALTQLEVLALRDMSLKNATVSQLLLNTPDKNGMTNLRDLSLFRNTDVTQALLNGAVLDKLHGLTALDLRETNVEGECLCCWKACCTLVKVLLLECMRRSGPALHALVGHRVAVELTPVCACTLSLCVVLQTWVWQPSPAWST